jgi:hypothetical protein
VTILISVILYIICIVPVVSFLSPLPTPLKAIAKGFLVLFHIGIWNPSTIYCHLNLLPSPSSLPVVHSPHHCAYVTVLIFIINIWVDFQRGVSVYAHCGCALFWAVQFLLIFSLTPLPHIPNFSPAFNTHAYILCLHILWYAILLVLYHSVFPFSFSLSSIE